MPVLTLRAECLNPVYRPFLNDTHRYQIFFGGAGSGKSVFVATRCALSALSGRNVLVVRRVARTLRASCWNEILKAMRRMGIESLFRVNRSESVMTAKCNGAQILFAGLDDVEKIKSITPARGALTDIWLEEATECDWRDFKQLDKRLRGLSRHEKRFIFTFNPIDREHWLYREFFSIFEDGKKCARSDDTLILKTTCHDNRFLSKADRDALENERDPYYYRVYTLGEWGARSGAIFTNWRAERLTGGENGETRFGLDFGFAQDPCGFVMARYDRNANRVYVLRELREKGLTNPDLARRILPIAGTRPVICDSAEPKSICELRALGVNACPARKGPDSVSYGVQWLRAREIILDTACAGMRGELAGYVWQTDRDGHCLNRPADKENHLIDALRYALENDSDAREFRIGSKRELGL